MLPLSLKFKMSLTQVLLTKFTGAYDNGRSPKCRLLTLANQKCIVPVSNLLSFVLYAHNYFTV